MYTLGDYPHILNLAMMGEEENHHGLTTLALNPLMISFQAGESVARHKFNAVLAEVEGLCLISGYTDLEAIKLAAPATFKAGYFDTPTVLYGEMYTKLVHQAIDDGSLRTRRCVLFGADNQTPPDAMPCAPTIQLQIRNGGSELLITVYQRSWDLIRGLPYNVTMWSMAATAWQELLGVEVASVHIFAANPHVYEQDLAADLHYNSHKTYLDVDYHARWCSDSGSQILTAREVLEAWKSHARRHPKDVSTPTHFLKVDSRRA